MKNFKTKEGIVIPFKKLLLMARLTMFVMILGLLQVSAESYSQAAKLKIKMKNVSIVEVFSEIERISQFRFFYDNDLVDLSQKVSIDAQGESITEVLDEIFLDTKLDYEIMDRFILVKSPDSKQVLSLRVCSIINYLILLLNVSIIFFFIKWQLHISLEISI
jgi:TonB-dependent starch-binding outer membrane protein SusC